jgi:hypothetical protein
VRLQPGETATARLELDARAFAAWDPGDPELPALRERLSASPLVDVEERPERGGWRVQPGLHALHVGRSSADVAHVVQVEVG